MNANQKAIWNSKWNLVLQGIGNDLVNELVRVTPVDSGNLRNSITYTIDNNGVNIKMLEYGYMIEFGTSPHIITPKKAKALHWKQGNADVFAQVVRHPGTEPNPFIRRTINTKLRNIIYKNIKRHLGNGDN